MRRLLVLLLLTIPFPALQGQSCDNRIAGVSYTGAGCSGTASHGPKGFCDTSQDVTFTATTTKPPQSCDQYIWKFGDGTPDVTGSSPVVTHRYTQAGTYAMTVTLLYGGSLISPVVVNAGLGQFYMLPDTVQEGSLAQIVVGRTSSAGAASVHYGTTGRLGGVAGRDFTPASGTLSFADGESSKTFSVQTLHNNIHTHPGSGFVVTLDQPSEGWLGSATGFVITDVDPPATVGLAESSYSVTEGTPLTVTLKRDGDLLNTIHFDLGFDSKLLSIPSSPGLSFDPNETSKTITLTPVDDDINHGTQKTRIGVSTVDDFNVGQAADVSIIDNDLPIDVSIDGDVTIPEGDGIDTFATFTVRLARAASIPLAVKYRVTPIGGSTGLHAVQFAAGSTSASLTVRLSGNTTYGPDQYFLVTITPADVATRAVHDRAELIVRNDDARIDPPDQRVATGSSVPFRVDLPRAAGEGAMLTLKAYDPTVVNVPASIPIDASATSVTFNVQGLKKGSTFVTATLPPAFGDNKTVQGVIRVIDPVTLTVTVVSSSAAMAVGDAREVAVQTSLEFPETVPVLISADDPDAISMPATIAAPAHFYVSLRKAMPVTLTFSAPAQFGAQSVTTQFTPDYGANPVVNTVSPAFGPTSGKTEVRVDGNGFVAPCTLSFGGAPATDLAIVSPAIVTATVPPGAPGKVTPLMKCGSSTGAGSAFTYQSDTPVPGISPDTAATDGVSLVRLTAAGASSGCNVTFDGVPARVVIPETPTTAVVLVPPSTKDLVNVVATCPGATITLPAALRYSDFLARPTYSFIGTLFGVPDQTVTINGTHFSINDTVWFGDSQATIVSSTPTEHVVRVPDIAPALVRVTIATNKNYVISGPLFTILGPLTPRIDSITPASGPAGTEVVIRGGGFRSFFTFKMGDQRATVPSLDLGRAIIRIPSGLAPGSYLITMLNATHDVVGTSTPFIVTADGPAISAVLPGCALTTGGTAIAINGSGFVAGATVTINGIAATNVTVVDASTIHATLPAGVAGDAQVIVSNPNGLTASLRGGFRYVSPYDIGGCAARPRLRTSS